MGRSVGAIIAGIVVFYVLVMGLEMVNFFLVYPPPGGMESLTDPEVLEAYMAGVPAMALAVVLIAHGVGAFAGSWTAGAIAEHRRTLHGSIIWGLGLIGAIWNLWEISHPAWFMILDVVFFPVFGLLGCRVGERRAGGSATSVSGMEHVSSEDAEPPAGPGTGTSD